MRAFLATSLKNVDEAKRIVELLRNKGIDCQCAVTDQGSENGETLFNRYLCAIAEADVFIALAKNMGTDTATEVGIACALGKRRILVVADDGCITPQDSMIFNASGLKVTELELPSVLESMIACEENERGHVLPFAACDLTEYFQPLITSLEVIFRSGLIVEGDHVAALEKQLGQRLGKDVILTSSGTLGLIIAIQSVLKDRKEVILPALTYPATVQAVIYAGGIPIYADVDPTTWTITVDEIARHLTPRTGAVLPVHLFGVPVDIAGIEELANEHCVPVIYDACQAFGSATFTGELGSVETGCSVFSMDATKVVTGGLGGFVSVDPSQSKDIRTLKNLGIAENRNCSSIGINSRVSEFSAILGSLSLQRVERELTRRRALAQSYDDYLYVNPNLGLQLRDLYGLWNAQMYGLADECQDIVYADKCQDIVYTLPDECASSTV